MKTTQAYWHMYHAGPFPLFFDTKSYDERVKDITTNKPPAEHELRLRLFQPVKGKLPLSLIDAVQVRDEARAVSNKTCDEHQKSRNDYGGQVKRDGAWKAYLDSVQAVETTDQAVNEALKANRKAILALHAKECPDCPWDGYTIFPKPKPKIAVD